MCLHWTRRLRVVTLNPGWRATFFSLISLGEEFGFNSKINEEAFGGFKENATL